MAQGHTHSLFTCRRQEPTSLACAVKDLVVKRNRSDTGESHGAMSARPYLGPGFSDRLNPCRIERLLEMAGAITVAVGSGLRNDPLFMTNRENGTRQKVQIVRA